MNTDQRDPKNTIVCSFFSYLWSSLSSAFICVTAFSLLFTLFACTPRATSEQGTLTVLAAASLTESFGDLGRLFESQHPGIKVAFSFGGSQQLAQQIDQGAVADVFASASQKYMEQVVAAGRIKAGAPQIFATNRLVVILPKANPAGIQALPDLARPGLKLDLADKSVPIGQYSLEFLDKASQDPAFGPSYKESVLKNVVSYEENVKAVVTKVSLNEADAGIVYVTDITSAAAARVTSLPIPDAFNTLATYPIAPLSDSKHPTLAQAFVSLVLSPEGQAVLSKYGFEKK